MTAQARDESAADSNILDYLKAERERAERYWTPVHEAIVACRSFAEGQHYESEEDIHERRAEDLRITGQENENVIRHKAAQLTDTPTMIEARPVDEYADPDDAELGTALLEAELGNPQKGYEDGRDLLCMSAVAARIGVLWIDWNPDLGPWGEITFRPGDATKVMWQPGYFDPHDLACDWLSEDRVMPRTELVAMLKGNRYANQDALARLTGSDLDVGARAASGASGVGEVETTSEVGRNLMAKAVSVTFWWLKNDRTTAQRPGPSERLAPDERYMVCATPDGPGCGWRGDPQGEIGVELPPEEPGKSEDSPETGCPRCGGMLMRIDLRDTTAEVLVYPKGKRLVITDVDQKVGEPLYDGPWPTMVHNPKSNIRSFPLYEFTSYMPIDPTRPSGRCDTERNWSAQVASDYIQTKGFRAAAQYQRYYSLPKVGVEDYNGLRFEFRDEQFNVMFRNPELANTLGPDALRVDVLEGSQFDPSLPAIFGMIQQTLNAKQGITDLGLTAENSKDIPATSLAQMTQVADVPMAHLKRRLHRALSRGHGVLWDMIRATYPRERMQRLQMTNGVDEVLQVRGDELPNYDFVVSDAPNFSGLEKAKSEALDRLIAVPPEWQEVYAQVNNIPPSVLRRVQKKQDELRQMQVQTGGGPAQQDRSLPTGPNGPQTDVPPPGSVDPQRQAEAIESQLRQFAQPTMTQ